MHWFLCVWNGLCIVCIEYKLDNTREKCWSMQISAASNQVQAVRVLAGRGKRGSAQTNENRVKYTSKTGANAAQVQV